MKDFVRAEQWRPDVDRRGRDPQVVGMAAVGERVSIASAREAQLRGGRQQTVTHRNDRRCSDPLFESAPSLRSPPGHERSVSEFTDRDGGEEDLVAGHQLHLGDETLTAKLAEGSAEDAGVDDDPHEPIAAANASSSISDSSSMTRMSIDASTGAVAS